MSFGYATIIALSESGVQPARSCYLENSASFVTAAYFDNAGAPFVPAAVSYRLDDLLSGSNILPWTVLTPALTNTVAISSVQNTMISWSRCNEAHQALFKITDSAGNVAYSRVVFDILRVVGSTS